MNKNNLTVYFNKQKLRAAEFIKIRGRFQAPIDIFLSGTNILETGNCVQIKIKQNIMSQTQIEILSLESSQDNNPFQILNNFCSFFIQHIDVQRIIGIKISSKEFGYILILLGPVVKNTTHENILKKVLTRQQFQSKCQIRVNNGQTKTGELKLIDLKKMWLINDRIDLEKNTLTIVEYRNREGVLKFIYQQKTYKITLPSEDIKQIFLYILHNIRCISSDQFFIQQIRLDNNNCRLLEIKKEKHQILHTVIYRTIHNFQTQPLKDVFQKEEQDSILSEKLNQQLSMNQSQYSRMSKGYKRQLTNIQDRILELKKHKKSLQNHITKQKKLFQTSNEKLKNIITKNFSNFFQQFEEIFQQQQQKFVFLQKQLIVYKDSFNFYRQKNTKYILDISQNIRNFKKDFFQFNQQNVLDHQDIKKKLIQKQQDIHQIQKKYKMLVREKNKAKKANFELQNQIKELKYDNQNLKTKHNKNMQIIQKLYQNFIGIKQNIYTYKENSKIQKKIFFDTFQGIHLLISKTKIKQQHKKKNRNAIVIFQSQKLQQEHEKILQYCADLKIKLKSHKKYNTKQKENIRLLQKFTKFSIQKYKKLQKILIQNQKEFSIQCNLHVLKRKIENLKIKLQQVKNFSIDQNKDNQQLRKQIQLIKSQMTQYKFKQINAVANLCGSLKKNLYNKKEKDQVFKNTIKKIVLQQLINQTKKNINNTQKKQDIKYDLQLEISKIQNFIYKKNTQKNKKKNNKRLKKEQLFIIMSNIKQQQKFDMVSYRILVNEKHHLKFDITNITNKLKQLSQHLKLKNSHDKKRSIMLKQRLSRILKIDHVQFVETEKSKEKILRLNSQLQNFRKHLSERIKEMQMKQMQQLNEDLQKKDLQIKNLENVIKIQNDQQKIFRQKLIELKQKIKPSKSLEIIPKIYNQLMKFGYKLSQLQRLIQNDIVNDKQKQEKYDKKFQQIKQKFQRLKAVQKNQNLEIQKQFSEFKNLQNSMMTEFKKMLGQKLKQKQKRNTLKSSAQLVMKIFSNQKKQKQDQAIQAITKEQFQIQRISTFRYFSQRKVTSSKITLIYKLTLQRSLKNYKDLFTIQNFYITKQYKVIDLQKDSAIDINQKMYQIKQKIQQIQEQLNNKQIIKLIKQQRTFCKIIQDQFSIKIKKSEKKIMLMNQKQRYILSQLKG